MSSPGFARPPYRLRLQVCTTLVGGSEHSTTGRLDQDRTEEETDGIARSTFASCAMVSVIGGYELLLIGTRNLTCSYY